MIIWVYCGRHSKIIAVFHRDFSKTKITCNVFVRGVPAQLLSLETDNLFCSINQTFLKEPTNYYNFVGRIECETCHLYQKQINRIPEFIRIQTVI